MPGDRARAGGEAGAGELVVDRVLEAHVDPADGVGQRVEAHEVDLGVVVDGQPREVADRAHQLLATRLGGADVDLARVGDAGLHQPVGLVGLRARVRRIDLVAAEGPGDRDVAVARDREGHRAAAVVGHPHQDHRVGVDDAVRGAGADRAQRVVGQRPGPARRCGCRPRPAGCRSRRPRRRRRGRRRAPRTSPWSPRAPPRPCRTGRTRAPRARSSRGAACGRSTAGRARAGRRRGPGRAGAGPAAAGTRDGGRAPAPARRVVAARRGPARGRGRGAAGAGRRGRSSSGGTAPSGRRGRALVVPLVDRDDPRTSTDGVESSARSRRRRRAGSRSGTVGVDVDVDVGRPARTSGAAAGGRGAVAAGRIATGLFASGPAGLVVVHRPGLPPRAGPRAALDLVHRRPGVRSTPATGSVRARDPWSPASRGPGGRRGSQIRRPLTGSGLLTRTTARRRVVATAGQMSISNALPTRVSRGGRDPRPVTRRVRCPP